jgi:uncharacterized protein YciI
MPEPKQPNVYYVVFCTTAYASFDDALAQDPATIAAHLARAQELHARGVLVPAGAFLDHPEEPLGTMAVLTTREAAEDYVRGDPFVVNGKVTKWIIREWAKLFA